MCSAHRFAILNPRFPLDPRHNYLYDTTMRLVEAITDNRHKPGRKRHIAHLVGDLPVILREIDPQDNMPVKKTYIWANGQILAQHDGDHTAESYFYLHDRLGWVRQIIGGYGYVLKYYTYEPFGEALAQTRARVLSQHR